MTKPNPQRLTAQAHERIRQIHQAVAELETLCTGTLFKSLMKCGKPTCRCHQDPAARHGPYYQWGHMKAGKLVRRYVSPAQAVLLRQAITNYRTLKKLIRAWEAQTERLIDAQAPTKS